MKYFVEYIENGTFNTDNWTERTLKHEIELNEVQIVGIYRIENGSVVDENLA